MKEKISFAEFIKNEILEFNWNSEQLDILFFSFLKTNGVFIKNNFIVNTSLKNKNDLILKWFKDFYNVKPKVKELKTKINYLIEDESFINLFYEKESNLNLDTIEKSMAFVSGAFVARGWVSKPSSRFYHLEFRLGSIEHSLNLQEALDSLGIRAKLITKDKWYITYIKKSMVLSDLLKAMQAHQAMMIFEEERINRDFTSSYSKMESIEAYNFQKTQAMSKIQIEAIEKLMKKPIWKTLSKDKIEIAKIRIENPNYSLSDIQYVFNEQNSKDVSKSTINNWFKYLIEMSKN